MKFLNIPGINDSGPGHWQTIWEEAFPNKFNRVSQKNWSTPVKNEWVKELNTAIQRLSSPTILIAHSLGCITVTHWAKTNESSLILGALLVAPADVERSEQECLKTFCPVPVNKLPFPSLVVASTNDEYTTIGQAAKWAAHWGSKFVCIGDKGHINAKSGLADWKEGFSLLSWFATPAENTAGKQVV